jgi:hypothetical protein
MEECCEKQCTWEYWSPLQKEFIRCPRKRQGYFFCTKHLIAAGKIDSCGFDIYYLGKKTPGGYRVDVR